MPRRRAPGEFSKADAGMTQVTADAGISLWQTRDGGRRLAIVVSLALVLLAAGAALFLLRGVDSQLSDVARTYETGRQARELIHALTEAESAQRGYLLTEDAAYLEPYGRAIATIATSYDGLIAELEASSDQQDQIAALRDGIERKRTEMGMTIQLASSGRLAEAMTVLRSGAGLSIMDAAGEAIRAFIAREDARLIERNAAVESYRQWLVAAIMAALAAAATLAYTLFTTTQRQVSALATTRNRLLEENETLEQHVRRRTAEVEEARAHAERERERVEALLRDTNHRIGNSLATVSSLLGLQHNRSTSAEVRAALEAAQTRVQAIASAHRRLRLGNDLETARADEFLDAVVEDLRSTQPAQSRIAFATEVEPIVIGARDATTLGIVVSELVTNAIKHAFPSGQGKIWVKLKRREDGTAILFVEDDGVGLGAGNGTPQGGSGLGSTIIQQLALQFGGETSYASREQGGTVVSVTLNALDPPPGVVEVG